MFQIVTVCSIVPILQLRTGRESGPALWSAAWSRVEWQLPMLLPPRPRRSDTNLIPVVSGRQHDGSPAERQVSKEQSTPAVKNSVWCSKSHRAATQGRREAKGKPQVLVPRCEQAKAHALRTECTANSNSPNTPPPPPSHLI